MRTFSIIIISSLLLMANQCSKIKMTPDPEPEQDVETSVIPLAENTIYTYALSNSLTPGCYDECVAASTLQGILNRQGPVMYLHGANTNKTSRWIEMFSKPGGWLEGRQQVKLESFGELLRLGKNVLKGVIIYDPDVPATINVATTMAGVEDGIVFSPEQAEKYAAEYGLAILHDFRGQFDGSLSGSAKNDAYRWAIDNYLDKGLCSTTQSFLYEDSRYNRPVGNLEYTYCRDFAVKERGFVFDLSPWEDEAPRDDASQPLGTDKATYIRILESYLRQTAGQHMTCLNGFFSKEKYSEIDGLGGAHGQVATEWESVWIASPYNVYMDTGPGEVYNMSFHSNAPFKPMKQGRPQLGEPQDGKTYLLFQLADYDGAGPLWEYMFNGIWNDDNRGSIPVVWGINPNLIDKLPDIMQYIWSTKTDADWFGADASCAGYINPNRIQPQYLPLFVEHNKKYYDLCDISLSPMVLDQNQPSEAVKNAFMEFSPDGLATIVMNYHGGGSAPVNHVWNGTMPVFNLNNSVCGMGNQPEELAAGISKVIPKSSGTTPRYYMFRVIWVGPGKIINAVNQLRTLRPDLDIEVLDPYNFFHYFKTTYNQQ